MTASGDPVAPRRVAVVGAGWAGLAAAVRAVQAGHAVTLFEMAGHPGGRARGVDVNGLALDNGQHILIGAYTRTLALMQTVGADAQELLCRLPLVLRYPDGRGLRAPGGAAVASFARAVAGCVGWTWRDRIVLLAAATGWALRRFRCDPALTVDDLCRKLPPAVRQLLIDPLCVAALNTPARDASAAVLLRVLRDALFGGPGSADLLLPRRPLGELLPAPAQRWLAEAGAALHLGRRVGEIAALPTPDTGWHVDGEAFDGVVLACSAAEAARLTAGITPAWSARAAALRYEPIITVYLRCPGARLAEPMIALVESDTAPAQFAFDHGALGATPGVFAFVISGARRWVDAGADTTAAATLRQATAAFPADTWPRPPVLLRVMAEKRATFRCTPGLDRPPAAIAPGLLAAGDYVAGPYPATLEGAVRSGEDAAAALGRTR
jgi:hydroxysqualene dehydroxylase